MKANQTKRDQFDSTYWKEHGDEFDRSVADVLKNLHYYISSWSKPDIKTVPQISYLKSIQGKLNRLQYRLGYQVPKIKGDADNFAFDWDDDTFRFSPIFKQSWIDLFQYHKLNSGDREAALTIFVLHEIFHLQQDLTTAKHGDIRNAQSVLRAVDYYADANAVLAYSHLTMRNAKRPDLRLQMIERGIRSALLAIEVFNHPLEKKRLITARFTRYFTWHMQYHRSRKFKIRDDPTWLQLLFEPTVDLHGITGRGSVKRRITRKGPILVTQKEVLSKRRIPKLEPGLPFLWLVMPNERAIPQIHRYYPDKPEITKLLFEGIFSGDLEKSKPFFDGLFLEYPFLVGGGVADPKAMAIHRAIQAAYANDLISPHSPERLVSQMRSPPPPDEDE